MAKMDFPFSMRSLRYFLQLTKTMNYTQAAKILGISQPALTQQIKKLERVVGAPLFKQNGRRLYLTGVGEEMHSAALKILRTVDHSLNEVQTFSRADRGLIRIGLLSMLDPCVLNAFLVGFANKFLKIHFELVTLNDQKLWQKLKADELDFIFTYLPFQIEGNQGIFKDQFDYLPFYKDQLIILTPEGSAEGKNNSLKKLLKERWVTFPGDSYLMKIFTKVCGFQQPFAGDIQTTSLDQLLWITQASLFNTVVTKSILKTHKTKQLTPIHSKHPIDLNLGLVFNKKAIKKKHLKNFIAEWQKFLAKADYSSRLKENEY